MIIFKYHQQKAPSLLSFAKNKLRNMQCWERQTVILSRGWLMTERCKLYQNQMVLLRWQARLNIPRSDSMSLNLNEISCERVQSKKDWNCEKFHHMLRSCHRELVNSLEKWCRHLARVSCCLSFLWTCQLPRRRWGVVGEQVGNPGRTLGAVSLGLISPRAPCQSVGLESVKLSWVDWSILIFS